MDLIKVDDVLSQVLVKITPSKEEANQIYRLADLLKKDLSNVTENEGMRAEIVLGGSVAKDTWIQGEADIDLFMMIPPTFNREAIEGICLDIARKVLRDTESLERYAEHPYIEAVVQGTKVNIVPCYRVEHEEWMSAVDRTPYHTKYFNTRMKKKDLRNEVRLLKQFMKGIGVYGAEIKIGGFSGYLCELLVIRFGSFKDLLKGVVDWSSGTIIDLEDLYKGDRNKIRLLFENPLIVIDPVDVKRNVAAAVTEESLFTFIAAVRHFVQEPDLRFFYASDVTPLEVEDLSENLQNRCTDIVVVNFTIDKAVPDVLWGQLFKSVRAIEKLFQINEFMVTRSSAWTDETSSASLVLELESRLIPSCKEHWGPLVISNDSSNFLKKHLDADTTVSGPWIESGRWVVATKRKYVDCIKLLHEKLIDGGVNIGISVGLQEAIKKSGKILINEEILSLYKSSREFTVFLTDFLLGVPKWLRKA